MATQRYYLCMKCLQAPKGHASKILDQAPTAEANGSRSKHELARISFGLLPDDNAGHWKESVFLQQSDSQNLGGVAC